MALLAAAVVAALPNGAAPAAARGGTTAAIVAAGTTVDGSPVLSDFELLSFDFPSEPFWVGLGDKVYDTHAVAATPNGRYVALTVLTVDRVAVVALWDRLENRSIPVNVLPDGSYPTDGGGTAFDDMSPDGRYVLFTSGARLTEDDNDKRVDAFRRDTVTGETVLVSVGPRGDALTGWMWGGGISADGRIASFMYEYQQGFTGESDVVFVRDVEAGVTTVGSRSEDGRRGDGCWYSDVSADGRYLAFDSKSNVFNHEADAGDGDVYVRDLDTGTVRSVTWTRDASYRSETWLSGISEDGTRVAFLTQPSETSSVWKPYVHDLRSGRTWPASPDTAGKNRSVESFFLLPGSRTWSFVASPIDLTGVEGAGTRHDLDGYAVHLTTGEVFRLTGPTVPAVPPAPERGLTHLWSFAVPRDRSFIWAASFFRVLPEDTDDYVDVYARSVTWP